MRNCKRVALALAFLAMAGAAEAVVPAGKPLLIELPKEVLAYGVGANGFVVVGGFFGETGPGLHWMPTSGVTAIGGLSAVAVSRDGKAISGNALDSRGLENAALWTGGTSWRLLGSITPNAQPCDRNFSATFGANADGTVLVGLAWDGCGIARAFRWEESTGMVNLGSLSGRSTRANAVSGDGRVVIGWDTATAGPRLGAKWVNLKQEMIQGPTGAVGEAFATNWDGSLIAGTKCDWTNTLPPATGWIWSQATGTRCLPVSRPSWAPDFPYQVLPESMSDDGRVIGGALSFGLDAESVVWFDGEPVMLRDYLRQNGVPDAFNGWINTGFVTAVSPDGRTLVGYGAGPTTFQGYVVVLPELGSK
jgi:probable HAF family extracellular repeat protein